MPLSTVTYATWIFASATLVSALVAAFSASTRKATLALWAAGLSAGALYLTLGAELLALLQWLVSTIVAMGSLFFVVVFDENAPTEPADYGKEILRMLPPILVAGAFSGALWLGLRMLNEDIPGVPTDGNNLVALGKALVEQHFLALEVVALSLFLALVGVGVISRASEKIPEDDDNNTTRSEPA